MEVVVLNCWVTEMKEIPHKTSQLPPDVLRFHSEP